MLPNPKKYGLRHRAVLILLVWLLSITGIRPAYHDHQIDGFTASELAQLAEHLRTYRHEDAQDTAKLHLHWLVQLDGNPIPAFPNTSPAIEQPVKSFVEFSECLEYGRSCYASLGAYDIVVYPEVHCDNVSRPKQRSILTCVESLAWQTGLASFTTTRQFSTSL